MAPTPSSLRKAFAISGAVCAVVALVPTLGPAGRDVHGLVVRYFVPVGHVMITGQTTGCVVTPVPWYRWRTGVVDKARSRASTSVDDLLLVRMAGDTSLSTLPLEALRAHALLAPIATLAAVGALAPLPFANDATAEATAWAQRRDLMTAALEREPDNGALWLAKACVELHLGDGVQAAAAAAAARGAPRSAFDRSGLQAHLASLARSHGMPERFMPDATSMVDWSRNAKWCIDHFLGDSREAHLVQLTEDQRLVLSSVLPLADKLDAVQQREPQENLGAFFRGWVAGGLMLIAGGLFASTLLSALVALALVCLKWRGLKVCVVIAGGIAGTAALFLPLASASAPIGLGAQRGAASLLVYVAGAGLWSVAAQSLAWRTAKDVAARGAMRWAWGICLTWTFALYCASVAYFIRAA